MVCRQHSQVLVAQVLSVVYGSSQVWWPQDWWCSATSVKFGHVEAMCGGAQVYDSASLMTSVSSVGCVAEAEVVIYVRRGSVTG